MKQGNPEAGDLKPFTQRFRVSGWPLAFCLAIAIMAAVAENGGNSPSANKFGEGLGRGLACWPVGVLISWLVFRLTGRSQKVANLAVCGIAFMLLLAASIGNARSQSTSARYLFEPNDCGVSAAFPSEPRVTSVNVAWIGGTLREGLKAELYTDNDCFFRAEAFQLDPASGFPADKKQGFEAVRQWALEQGFATIELDWKESTLGKEVWMRGTKTISVANGDTPGTYRIRWIFGKTALLSLIVSGPAENFPGRGQEEFLASARSR